MPQVRQVDYSAIGNNAYTQLQASGSQNFSPMIEQIASAGAKWIESLNDTDEKEAAKLAQKVALAQDEAKEQILIDMQMNPSDASSWEERWKKAVDSINQTYGIADMDKNSYRYRQFEEKMQVPTHNARMAMIKSYNNIQIKDIQETAKSSVDFAINNAINADAMVQVSDINTKEVHNVVDNAQAVAEVGAAIENYARVNNLSDEAKGLLFQDAKAKLALGVANRAISMASDAKALDTIDRLLRNIGNEAAPEAEKNAIRGAFGDIDPNALTPEKRVALQDAIRRKRALLDAQAVDKANQSYDAILFDLYDGKRTCSEAAAQIEEIRKTSPASSFAKYESVTSKVERYRDGQVEKAWNDARAMVEAREGANSLTPSQKVALMEAAIPEEYKTSDVYKTLVSMELKGLGEAYKKQCEIRLDDAITDLITNGAYSESEAIERLDDLVKVNPQYFSGIEGQDRIKKIESEIKTNRLASVAGLRRMVEMRYTNQTFTDTILGNVTNRTQGVHDKRNLPLLTFDAKGDLNVDTTYTAIKRLNPVELVDPQVVKASDANLRQALLGIRAAYEATVQVARENPSYTAEDLYKIFNANVGSQLDEAIMIQHWTAPISLDKTYQQMETFLNMQSAFNSAFGVGYDIPLEETMMNATAAKNNTPRAVNHNLKGTPTGKGATKNEDKPKLGDEYVK
jgi:hypothetical protein